MLRCNQHPPPLRWEGWRLGARAHPTGCHKPCAGTSRRFSILSRPRQTKRFALHLCSSSGNSAASTARPRPTARPLIAPSRKLPPLRESHRCPGDDGRAARPRGGSSPGTGQGCSTVRPGVNSTGQQITHRPRHPADSGGAELALRISGTRRRIGRGFLRRATMIKFQPDGWHTITPRIIVRDPESLISFVKRVFGGHGEFRPGRTRRKSGSGTPCS